MGKKTALDYCCRDKPIGLVTTLLRLEQLDHSADSFENDCWMEIVHITEVAKEAKFLWDMLKQDLNTSRLMQT